MKAVTIIWLTALTILIGIFMIGNHNQLKLARFQNKIIKENLESTLANAENITGIVSLFEQQSKFNNKVGDALELIMTQ